MRQNFVYNGSRVGPVARGGTEQQCCASCTELPACWHYSWHPLGSEGQETFCEHHADDGAFVASNPTQDFAAGSVTTHVYCHTEMDCSLAGECVDGACVCDGWTHGAHCEILNLEPAQTAHLGYHNSSGWNSWGGASIEFDGKWFLFASQMQGRCPLLGYWLYNAADPSNDRIDHAASPEGRGRQRWRTKRGGGPAEAGPKGLRHCPRRGAGRPRLPPASSPLLRS